MHGELILLLVGWLLMLVGIWHPYVIDVSPADAAALGTMFGIVGAYVVVADVL